MQTGDRQAFAAVMTRLAEVFDRPLSDRVLETYWDQLKDQPLAAVQRRAEQHMRSGKFFPRPAHLRPADERPGDPLPGTTPQELERLNQEANDCWRRVIAADADEGRLKLALARASRLEATLPKDHPALPDAIREAQEAQRSLQALWARRQKDVSRDVPRGTSPAKPAPLSHSAVEHVA